MSENSPKGLSAWLKSWNDPTIIVHSENAYSIVAKSETANEKFPFQRYQKYKDKQGIYINFRRDKRVYENKWKRVF